MFSLLAHPLFLAAQQGQGQGRGGGRGASILDVLARPKFVTMLVIGFIALVLLLTRKMTNKVKVPILLLSTFLYGIAANLPIKLFAGFSMHPSPICSATKSILYGFRPPMIAMLAVILVLTIVGPKLFCGWVCPVGAVQELIAMLADKLRIRRRKWNFRVDPGRPRRDLPPVRLPQRHGHPSHDRAERTARRPVALRLHQRLPRLRDRSPADACSTTPSTSCPSS
ncbi:MAG: 4Fe-4S binding protein [Candidatus Moduliflexus flocculans]|nr:4Fe-4S binding protein [Candidatus Moduliflexus flocculans]